MNKVLIVGMNPSNWHKPNGRNSPTYKKLVEWMTECGVTYFSFCNTFNEPGEPKTSKIDYSGLQEMSSGYDKILALGVFVSKALDKLDIQHFKLPHPSPRNRLFNNKDFESSIINQCKFYLQHTN